jgi:phosphoserine phosphatase RsbU/P
VCVTALIDLHAFGRDLEALNSRVSQLRTSRHSFADSDAEVLDAALLELETAEDELRACQDELEASSRQLTHRSSRRDREHQLLRQVFRHLPFPVFVLDQHGAIRQANPQAATLTGTPLEFLAGKPMPVFIDMPARAAFRSHLAAVLHSGQGSVFGCRFTGRGHPVAVQLLISRLTPPDNDHPAALATAWTGGSPAEPRSPATLRATQVPAAVEASLRLEVMSEMTKLLLGQTDSRQLLPAAAQLLVGECADWAIIDLIEDGKPVRQAAAGPRGPVTTAVSETQLIKDLVATGGPVLLDPIEDEAAFGHTPSGAPILAAAHAGSLISVAIPHPGGSAGPAAGGGVAGVLTVIRRDDRRGFSLADLSLFSQIAGHIAIALRGRPDRLPPAAPGGAISGR